MCLAAAYWARVDRIFFANTRKDAESVGFGDNFIYQELGRTVSKRNLPLIPFLRKEGGLAFKEWRDKPNKTSYGPTL